MVLALAPLWLAGILGRGAWTPDEPREADIAWRMSLQQDRTLPELAGTPFLEKPPLSYWAAATGIGLFGDSAAAARAANLLYAITVALAVAALALACGTGRGAALLGALVASSALLSFRISSWLAPDAALLAGNALALLGLWYGYRSPPGRIKACGYALMHLGAAVGFMAKSAPGWLVPGLALLVLIAWERRFRELARWELYAGFVLQVLVIGPWLWRVALRPDGAEALRTLFWNNIAGRFTHIDAPAALDYTTGHRNRPGKYLIELPVYLLPWTLVALASLRRAWRSARAPAPDASPWRLALAASVPLLLLLSFAATARDVYAAPALLGFALLAALWCGSLPAAADAFDRACLAGTGWLIGVMATMLAVALLVLARAGECSAAAGYADALLVLLTTAVLLALARRAQRRGDAGAALTLSYGAYLASLCLAAFVAFPVIDRWQDLGAIAQAVRSDTRGEALALLAPDETTLAIIDHGNAQGYAVLEHNDAATAASWFGQHGPGARLLVLLPGHGTGNLSRYLGRWLSVPAPGDGIAATLVTAGAARIVRRYELPQGRRYALLGPPVR